MESGRERKRGMEQSTSSSSSLFVSATEDEIIVAQILLDLEIMFSLPAPLPYSSWGCRRKRSCLEGQPPNALATPPPPENRIEEQMLRISTTRAAAAEEESVGAAFSGDSPNTPLSFSPIVYDENPLHSSKKSFKKGGRRKEELLDMVEELTRCKDLLTRELEKVKKYYDELITCNSQLKAKKQEVLKSRELNQHHQTNPPMAADHNSIQSQPSDDGLGSVDQGGPRDFDLNIPAEESFSVEVYQPLDVMRAVADKRARFAEARRNRVRIIKTKSNKRTLG